MLLNCLQRASSIQSCFTNSSSYPTDTNSLLHLVVSSFSSVNVVPHSPPPPPPTSFPCSCHQKCILLYLLLLLECIFSKKLFLSVLVHMLLLLSFNIRLFWFLLTSLFLWFFVSSTPSCILKHTGSFCTKLCLFIVRFCTIQISRNAKSTSKRKKKRGGLLVRKTTFRIPFPYFGM